MVWKKANRRWLRVTTASTRTQVSWKWKVRSMCISSTHTIESVQHKSSQTNSAFPFRTHKPFQVPTSKNVECLLFLILVRFVSFKNQTLTKEWTTGARKKIYSTKKMWKSSSSALSNVKDFYTILFAFFLTDWIPLFLFICFVRISDLLGIRSILPTIMCTVYWLLCSVYSVHFE